MEKFGRRLRVSNGSSSSSAEKSSESEDSVSFSGPRRDLIKTSYNQKTGIEQKAEQ